MERLRLFRDSLFNMSANVLSAVFGLIAVPLFVSRLPTGDYADWIVTLATAKSTVLIDFGIGWTVVHIIAADITELRRETRAHLRAAAVLLAGLALIAGAATFAIAAVQLGDLDHNRIVLLAAGAVMAAVSHVNNYTIAVLWGLRRFDMAGTIVAVEAGVQSSGVVVILLLGGDIAMVAIWEAAVVLSAAVVKILVVRSLCPAAAFRITLHWPQAPFRLVRFGLASQISDGLSSLFWSVGVMFVGLIASPAAVVLFHLAQKVPLALAGFVTRAAEVTMPAASGLAHAETNAHAVVAVTAARIAVALSAPGVVMMWVMAAPFMTLWVGHDVDVLATVMRIAAIGIAAHSLAESARHFLWGTGRLGTIIIIQSIGAAVVVTGTVLSAVLGQFDIESFAALQTIAIGFIAAALSAVTARRAGLSGRGYALRVARGVPVASFAALAVGSGIAVLQPGISWLCLSSMALGVITTFVVLMIRFGLEPEETLALRHLIRNT